MNGADGQAILIYVDASNPTEYFCTNCLQLRLSMIADKSHCRNCNSTEIITGKVGTLNKAELKAKYAPK